MRILIFVLGSLLASGLAFGQDAKPKLNIDEFFNSVSFSGVKLSSDGNAVVFDVEKADWDRQIFRSELWLYRISGSGGSLIQLTQSGHDSAPQWSPDGQWVAFLSERKAGGGKDSEDDDKGKEISQMYLISPNGGESFAITSGDDEVHSFAWAPDSKAIYFATRQPWTKDQNDAHKKDWKDVIRFRSDDRGDVIFRIGLAEALSRHGALGVKEIEDAAKDSGATPGAVVMARTPWRAEQIAIARDGSKLAFMGTSVSERNEKVEEYEVYQFSLTGNAEATPIRLTKNEAVETNLDWAADNRHLFFQTELGSAEGKYEDPQPRLYWVDSASGEVQRWFADYKGHIGHYTPMPDGSVLCACRMGTEVELQSQANPKAAIVKREGWPGTYDDPASARQSQRIAFVYSAIERPTEVYIADSPDKLAQARPITSFNKLFTQRDLPKAKPYRWTSDDGTQIEGMLMYPPGKYEAKNLPMFVFIHGGPQDADGNHFEADWYQWDRLAATQGWLVFEPNYRGSTGYGDKFALQISPEIVSKPGRDVLTGVDALVKDGIADANRLAVGGYSYGGYMTNWLITQTTRFKAAVTGAGAVEHIADWGNDDTGFDDVWFLGGHAWEVPDRYRSEAAIYQIDKVRTPTHIVGGSDDVRVAVLENYLLDRALHELNIPSELLIFPGEGHGLGKNPWHGRIKVREELKWLTKYGGVGTGN
ncbi:MAG TPA: S9 family peptidase [Terriglobales bacterium]|jgi:dipeptidyl aminopeptidase/acylaminoacyl peptidase|nr:S9 family peptidase [Terriglobales bacterium]